MSSTYRIDTHAIPVEVSLSNGAPLSGEIFLRPGVGTHTGPETVADRLADESAFMPMRIHGDPPETLLIGKAQIRYLRTAAALPSDDDEASAIQVTAPVVTVEAELDTGEKVSGTVQLVLQPGQTRTLDFLNSRALPFVRVARDGKDCFVNRAYVRVFREVKP